MSAIDEFLGEFDEVQKGTKEAIKGILETISDTDARKWMDQVDVRNRKIAGTRYYEIGNILSFNSFYDRYVALGYNFGTLAAWKDWRCGITGCEASTGYSCNPDKCP